MKKFTIKAISMILMLAMTLSVTAMAASYAGTPATYKNSTNRNAYLDYLVANGKNKVYEINTDSMENPNDQLYYYKRLAGYYSPIGGPAATNKYLVANFGYSVASCWANMLSNAISRAGCYCENISACTCDITTAADVNSYLDYLLTGTLDNDFVSMKNIYGETVASEFVTNTILETRGDKHKNWSTVRADYITASTKFNEDGTYGVYKNGMYSESRDNLVPLDVIAAVNAFADPLAAAISAAIPDWNTSKDALHGLLFATNLYPLDHELSVTNGRTISTDEAVRIAKSILASDDPDMGGFAMASRNVVAAINAARNGKASNILEDRLVDNGNSIPTTNVTIIADGKAVTLEAVILNNTTYFKIRDLAPVMNGYAKWGDWYGTGPDGNASGYIGTGISVYTNDTSKVIGNPAPLSPAETRDSRVSIVTINTNIQLEAIVLSNEYGATTYFKIRDIAAILHYNVTWDADTGISVTAM